MKNIVLTKGEELYLQRRRAKRTQIQDARIKQLTPAQIQYAEGDPLVVGEREVNDQEYLVLLRRRTGLTAQEVANSLRISRPTLAAWEKHDDFRLRQFLEQHQPQEAKQ